MQIDIKRFVETAETLRLDPDKSSVEKIKELIAPFLEEGRAILKKLD